MSNDIVYDNPRISEMDYFLKRIYEIKKSNPDFQITQSFVYKELYKAGVKKEDLGEDRSLIPNMHFFPQWKKRFSNDRDIDAYCDPLWSYFFQFKKWNSENEKKFIKLYIPIDYNHLYEGANILFDYIKSLGIEHASKISSYVRSDNVIVRLKQDDYYSAFKIINFVKNHPYFKDGLNLTNPFVPSINGIGFMEESGFSYNHDMSEMISQYINHSYGLNKNNVNINDFKSWMDQRNYDNEVGRIFNQSLGIKNQELTSSQKVNLFIDALNATYQKYDYSQAYYALLYALNGDYSYITNGSKETPNYRDLLIKSVSPGEIRIFVYSALEQIMGPETEHLGIESAVDKYCRFMFNNRTMNFDEICKVTIEKYDEGQCNFAIKQFLENGERKGFTRYSTEVSSGEPQVNYRDMVSTYNYYSMMEAIKKSLMLRNINCENLLDFQLVDMYTNELGKSYCESGPKNSKNVK